MGYMVKPGDVVLTGTDTREKVYILLNKPKKLADGRRSEYRVYWNW
jgi:hypothetical protein